MPINTEIINQPVEFTPTIDEQPVDKFQELMKRFNVLEQKVDTLMRFFTETPHDYEEGTLLGVDEEGKASAIGAEDIWDKIESYALAWAGAIYATIASPTFTGTVTSEGPASFEDDVTILGDVILPKTITIKDTTGDHKYILAVNELTADRTITLPLLTGNDELVLAAHIKTLTNKRITKRSYSTTSVSTLTPEKDTYDYFELTAQAADLSILNHSTSTPVAGDSLIMFITTSDADKTIGFASNYSEAGGIDLPTTLTASKTTVLGFVWNAGLSKYVLVHHAEEE